MRRLSINHHAADRFKPNPLVDETGTAVLQIVGDWGQVDADGRTELFLSPDLAEVAKGSAVSGLLAGLIGGTNDPIAMLRNQGEGIQTLRRAKVPMRGVPFRHTDVARVVRTARNGADPDAFGIQVLEPNIPPATFEQRATSAELQGYANGFADARFGVYDLVRPDGALILRHWAAIDAQMLLAASTFDVADDAYPLAEAVMLCLARYLSWRF